MVDILPEMKLAEMQRVLGGKPFADWTMDDCQIWEEGKTVQSLLHWDVISYLTIIMKLRCGGLLMTFLFLGIVRWRTVILSLISSVCLCSEAYIDV